MYFIFDLFTFFFLQIYVSYEQSTQDMFLTHGANVEYIEDIVSHLSASLFFVAV